MSRNKIIFFLWMIGSLNLFAQNSFLDNHFNSEFYSNQWVGFSLYNPQEKIELYNYQSNKYFIPASNVKILTLYTGLKLMPDSVPSLQYLKKNDTLYIKGTGDPTLLESYFKENKVIHFLKNSQLPIALYIENWNDTAYAPGCSWDDFVEDYSPERSPFPIYGNLVTLQSQKIVPKYFANRVLFQKKQSVRDLNNNIFYYAGNKKIQIPFIISKELIKNLLEEETNQKIFLTNNFPKGTVETLYSIPSDELFKRMMLVSDNFIAEQILLMSSLNISEMLNSQSTIQYILKTYLNEFPQKPRWVDGSGLSRYNNLSPKDLVYVLNQLYEEIPTERLLSLFAVGGVNGTLKNSYPGNPPYVYAKTGSMGQVYNLSGYLKTKSGKILTFSFMNNNFQVPTSQLKVEMKKVLEYVRDYY
ncbi:D-alanyl-D-alanine carboxypeptidase [Apibacter muscae]|uniref:D-alanyl-D-alanine carboxypeptidase n=1 Tax=Apibacter muscae TaxID=2509004 RepID=A0A563D9B7_9FLAO|nr:D-alanyl-D-alanine carboxypeptidase [Apibacter muscae]TWP26692.1 D-alanyl-D-alanine carboxypeptidase [Apibacter muscae]